MEPVCAEEHPEGLGPCAREQGHEGQHGRAVGSGDDFHFERWD